MPYTTAKFTAPEVSPRFGPFFRSALTCIVMTICLTMTVHCRAADMSSPDPSLLDKGKAYLMSGNFNAAYDTFFTLFTQTPGDPNVNFYLGRSAFEAGDYEAALMAFERVLMHTPDAQRIKLEMARCYVKLRAYEMARKLFREVEATKPPAPVKERIQQIMAQMREAEKRHFLNGMFLLDVGYDNNAATAPSDSTSQDIYPDLPALNVDEAISDIIYTQVGSLNYRFKMTDTLFSWETSGIIYNALYNDESDLNINYFYGSTGPVFHTRRFSLDVKGHGYHTLLDGVDYLTTFGGSSKASFLIGSHYLTSLSLAWEKRNYVGEIPEDKDADNISVTNTHNVMMGPAAISLTIGYETEDAENESNSYDRLEAGIAYMHQLPFQIKLNAAFSLQKDDYKEKIDDSTRDKRSDTINTYRAGISKSFWYSSENKLSLTGFIDYTFTDAQSNLDLYDYTQNNIHAGCTFVF